MKILYIDAANGLSGDMLLGALVDAAGSDRSIADLPKRLQMSRGGISCRRVSAGKVRGISVTVRAAKPAGASALGRPMIDIMQQLGDADLSSSVKSRARQVYRRIGEAEAKCHGVDLSRVHLHELGDADAMVAIVGVALLVEELEVQRVIGSSLVLERGTVRTREGVLPLPSPATMELLRGWPVRVVDGGRERVTPTGAALLSVLAQPVESMPLLRVVRTGWGVGTKRFDGVPGTVRAVLGEGS